MQLRNQIKSNACCNFVIPRRQLQPVFEIPRVCPGTLKIDFTHISQKTSGGSHRPHAWNCFHCYIFRDITNTGNDYDDDGRPRMERPKWLSLPSKVAWLSFTSGIDFFHGTLSVREGKSGNESPSRRLALTMWYVTTDDSEEQVPEYGKDIDGRNEEEEDPNRTLAFRNSGRIDQSR